MGSLEFVAHRISSGSLSPPRLVVWLFCYLPPYLIKTAIFGSVTTTMSFIKRSSNPRSWVPGLIVPCKQWWWSSSEALSKLKSCFSFIWRWQSSADYIKCLERRWCTRNVLLCYRLLCREKRKPRKQSVELSGSMNCPPIKVFSLTFPGPCDCWVIWKKQRSRMLYSWVMQHKRTSIFSFTANYIKPQFSEP